MSDQVGNQNVGFLMTRLNYFTFGPSKSARIFQEVKNKFYVKNHTLDSCLPF